MKPKPPTPLVREILVILTVKSVHVLARLAKMDAVLAVNRRCGELNVPLIGDGASASLLKTVRTAALADRWGGELMQCAAAPRTAPHQARPT